MRRTRLNHYEGRVFRNDINPVTGKSLYPEDILKYIAIEPVNPGDVLLESNLSYEFLANLNLSGKCGQFDIDEIMKIYEILD